MSTNNNRYYRSQSLNAQWEDLSQSVSNLLQDHEGLNAKAEVSATQFEAQRKIDTSHWVKEQDRVKCSATQCEKKFTLTERKHHCRRCGEVFCGKCTQYRRRLNALAVPDSNGFSYRVCWRCFDVGPQTLGVCSPRFAEFDRFKRLKRTLPKHTDSNTPADAQHETDVLQECNRLVNGFKNSIGTSKIRSLVIDFMSPVKVPEWQRSKNWKPNSAVSHCMLCERKFTITDSKSHCRVCGEVICSTCSSDRMILYVTPDGSVKWALIDVVGSPEKEPELCFYLKLCNSCHMKVAEVQGQSYVDGPSSESMLDSICTINHNIICLQGKVTDLLPKYENLVDAVEAKGDLRGLVPQGSSATQELARYHFELSDLFTQFAVDMQPLKRLKPKTNSQIKLAKNLTKAKFDFYNDNFYLYRDCKKRMSEILPPQVLEKMQETVDQQTINNAYIIVKQLGLESLLLAQKYSFEADIAMMLSTCEDICQQDLKVQIETSREEWESHLETINKLLQLQIKEHRIVKPSRRLSQQQGGLYVREFLVERLDIQISKTLRQLRAKTTSKKFTATKSALEKASAQLGAV